MTKVASAKVKRQGKIVINKKNLPKKTKYVKSKTKSIMSTKKK